MRRLRIVAGSFFLLLAAASAARGQSFGVELNNTLMPASGGMAGASIAMPQDLTSGINGNPASLTQFAGTQFVFGGAWAEPTFNLQTADIPLLGVTSFSGKQTGPGSAVGNIGVTQDLSALGLPATFGLAFTTTAGALVDFRNLPASNGTNSALTVFELTGALSYDVTERLSVGAGVSLGIAFFDGPFVEIGGMTLDYALRGILGVNYIVNDATTAGFYYQTKQKFKFDNAVSFDRLPNSPTFDVRMDLPENLGFGIANNGLMEGRLLVAVDVLYKLWDQTNLFGAIYDNQWVVQVGTQYTTGKYKLRAGYAYAQNPLSPNPGPNLGGITPPGGIPSVFYTQALLAVANPHRISAGIGVVDVLPGIDMDLMAGGMLRDHEQEGPLTSTSLASYWVGLGLTWRFGRGACCRLPVPDDWGCSCSEQ